MIFNVKKLYSIFCLVFIVGIWGFLKEVGEVGVIEIWLIVLVSYGG